ncbi:MAG TPA: dephospho-CoA kinase [Candidatus Pullilachnospira stercoravium]|uniref:Dephospho-CoA kinase n=1 Tax=Candidatus Pullilachnospira stercoravium TaxID=2840913 RepID=A0A9D1T5E2_9FIRM|nr:dephospho-CoA kinase [Candidatus Pullilachnospira stercoravium]
MKIIGITGGVGAGKSEVLNFIAGRYDATVVEADQVGYLVMQPGKEAYEPVAELFGPSVVKEDQTLDREKIAQIVFEDRQLLEKLNAIVHPAVKRYIRRAIQMEQEAGTEIFVVEAALLIEDKYDEICDELWYIYADENVRMHRLMKNRGYSVEKIRGILANQLSEEEFESHCDFEIDNSGDFQDTVRQIEQRMRMYEIM